jgi:hypothetical protein
MVSDIQIITKERHSRKYWQPTKDFSFAAKDVLCALVAQEMPQAAMSLPTGFTRSEDCFIPVALLGLKMDQNLIVDPQGAWRSPYVPDVYKCYPFSPGKLNNEFVLCVDEDAVSLNSETGQTFFESDGEINKTIARIQKFYIENAEFTTQTEALCKLLDRHGLFETWPIQAEVGGMPIKVEGIFRISETRLNSLNANELTEVRDSGGLIVAYSQLLSMTHINDLVHLAQNSVGPAKSEKIKELDFDTLNENSNLDFSNF